MTKPQHPAGGAVPDFLRVVVAEEEPASEGTVAEQALLALNSSMMKLYDETLVRYTRNLRERVPIIVALFTGEGGQMVLYRPGEAPLAAEPVPVIYQLTKSVGHSSMAIYQIVTPYLSHPSDKSWRGPMSAYRAQNQTALETLDGLAVPPDQREVFRAVLVRNQAFMDACLAAGSFTYGELERFCRDCTPHVAKLIGLASAAQVAHWMGVVERWKRLLGGSWGLTYAVNNTLYVTRQNNILYTILAQFMGEEAIGDRLILIETPEFTTTPEQLLASLTRIVADRGLGMVFFKDYFLMDVELLSGGARRAIEREAAARGMTPLLPSVAPFYTNEWPWKTDPKKGQGPSSLDEVR